MVFLQFTPVFVPNTAPNIAFWVIVCGLAGALLMLIIPKSYFTSRPARARQRVLSPLRGNVPPPPPSLRVFGTEGAVQRHGTARKLWSPIFIIGFLIIFQSRLAMAPVTGFLSLYVVEHLRWDAVGLMWALSSGSEIVFIFLSKSLIRRFKALPLMAFSTFVILVRYAIILLFPSGGGIVVSQLTHSVCYGVFHPAAVSFISSCVPPERRALGMSLYLSLGTGVPTLLGNISGGFIVEYLGYRSLFLFFSLFAVSGLLLYFATKKFTRQAGQPAPKVRL